MYTAATSLATGSMIYVVTPSAGEVYYWVVGVSTTWPMPWLTFGMTNEPTGQKMQGIIISNGAVYAISSNASDTWLCRAFLPAVGFDPLGKWAAHNVGAQSF